MAAGGYDGAIKLLTKMDQSGFIAGRKQLEKQIAGMKKSLTNFAAAVGIAFSAAAIISFGKKSVRAASEMTNALIGLQSIMEGQGRSFKKAQGFIEEYISDGLIPATQAITAYKNLALRGYDDSQIQQVLVALKDSAAFGRQASYTMGEAIATATEGLKNENSILVDNAGVTKNVAKMWDEYAKSIGTTASSLTKQQKIQAEVNGILEESKYQVGDAAKVANSYSGQILRLSFAFNNLKIAIGNAIIPIVQSVLPAINAIIDALTRAMNVFAQFTTAVFGKGVKNQEKIASTASAGAKAENQLAAATKKAGDATEKAGKQAKGALASFDELNVLAKNDAAGIEAADIGAIDYGSSLDVGGEIGAGVTVNPVVQAAVDTLMEILKPLKEISFDNLSAAFDRLKEAVAPFGEALFAGLKWAYLNILVPLAKWTIEEYVPALFEYWAAALKVFGSAIEALKPLAAWLWDKFLKPIAAWTGDLIVAALELVTDALYGISDWINNNQGPFQVMTGIVLLFFAAWKVTELFAFIQMSGGLLAALRAIQAATFGAAAAKAKDLAITAALKIMYAGDFIKSVATVVAAKGKELAAWTVGTAAKIKDAAAQTAANVATGIWNGLAVVGTAVTTAFGAAVAFLTSPIGLVILAIAALIAMVILLVKHWDKVKAAAINVWRTIVDAWGKASEWFDNKVLSPIKNTFRAAINFMIGLAEGFINRFIRGINAIIKALNSLSIDVPKGVPFIGGTKFGIDIPSVKEIDIPRLATGAVIPPNAEFLAVLGDQKSGANIETPEKLLRQIVKEEIANFPQPDIRIVASGDEGGLIRYLKFEIDKENRRLGRNLIEGSVLL